jgi:hypothetical protein
MGWGRILSIMLVLASGGAAAQAPWPAQQQQPQQQPAQWPSQQPPAQQQPSWPAQQSQGQQKPQGGQAWPSQQPQRQANWPAQQQPPAQQAWPAQQAAMPAAPMGPGGGMAPGGGMMPPGGGGMMGPGGGGEPPCVAEFHKLRGEFEKRAVAAKSAHEQKQPPTREEFCTLISAASAASAKWAKYTVAQGKSCGIPADAVKQIKGQDDYMAKLKKQVCSSGGPAAPSLAEALGTDKLPLDEGEKKQIKRGGVLDSLTGAPIQ